MKETIDFYSNKVRCSALSYKTSRSKPKGLIVMAHGLGGVKELWIDKFAEFFAHHGYDCFLFDYRNHGASDGNKRYLVSVRDQLRDWNNAIDFAKQKSNTDSIILFGTSLSGGHVIKLLAKRADIKMAISQCPYTNALATLRTFSAKNVVQFTIPVTLDLLSCLTGYHPYMIRAVSENSETALMNIPNNEKYIKRFPKGIEIPDSMPARTILELLKYSPGKYFKKITKPILVAPCLKDSLTPSSKTIELAKKCKTSTIKKFNCDHFDIYFDEFFKDACKSYLEFLDSH